MMQVSVGGIGDKFMVYFECLSRKFWSGGNSCLDGPLLATKIVCPDQFIATNWTLNPRVLIIT